MRKWTIEQLKTTDDISFAMCILSERSAGLNPNAPLAQKLQSAHRTLDDIRDGAPMTPGTDMWGSMRERIYREKDREYLIEDIKCHAERDAIDLQGLTSEEVLTDEDIIAQILYRYGKCETDHWDNMEHAVEQGVKEILDSRKGATT